MNKFLDGIVERLKELFEFENEFTERMGYVTQKVYAKSMIITYIVFLLIMASFGNAKGIGGFWGLLVVLLIFGSIWFFSCKYPVSEIFLNSAVGYILSNIIFSVANTMMTVGEGTGNTDTTSPMNSGTVIESGTGSEELGIPFLAVLLGTVTISMAFGYIKTFRVHNKELRKEELTIAEEEYHKKTMKISALGTLVVSMVLSFFINNTYTVGDSIGKIIMIVLFILAFNIVSRMFSGEMAQERRNAKRRKDEMKEQLREQEREERMRNKMKRKRY